MGKGVFSDKDITRKLGKSIFIYPFREENLKGSTYNLTASLCAWIIKGNEKQLIINKDGVIEIPPGETALIETEESIYVSNNISGTYHSRVSLCNKGLSHVGTTLDPCYFGTSVIALHNNNRKKSVKIKPNESIVSIMFYDMKSNASQLHDNFPFRKDLFDLNIQSFYKKYWECNEIVCEKCKDCNKVANCNYKLLKNDKEIEEQKQKILNDLERWKNEKWRTNRNHLIKAVKKYVFNRDFEKNIFKYSILCIVSGLIIIVAFILWEINIDFSKNQALIGALNSIITIIPPTVAMIIAMIIRYQKRGEL